MNLKRFCSWWQCKAFRWAVGLAAGTAIAVVAITAPVRALYGSSEFGGFRQIVQVSIVQGRNHYVAIEHVRAYPPFFAIFWAPFGLLPVGEPTSAVGASLAYQLQMWLSAALLVTFMIALSMWAAWLAASVVRPLAPGEPRWCFPLLVWLLSGGLLLNSVVRCETDAFVVAMVVGGMWMLLSREREWAAGGLLGIAAALKLTPALFAMYAVCRRQWRTALGMLAGAAVCTIVLPVIVWGPRGAFERHVSWMERVLIPYVTCGPEMFIGRPYRAINQSPKAALVRFLTHYESSERESVVYPHVAHLPMGAVSAIAAGFKLAVLVALVGVWLKSPRRAGLELEATLFALVPLGMLLLSDVSITGHMAILLVPFATLAGYGIRHAGQEEARKVGRVVVLGFALTHLVCIQQLKALSFGTLGILVLFAGTWWLAMRLREGVLGSGTAQ